MNQYSLSDLSSLLYLFGNDIRLLHLYTSGIEFFAYHEKLNELYDVCFDMYDALAEMAISHNEKICNPTDILNESDVYWEIEKGDYFDAKSICEIIQEKGKYVIECINNISKYESFVQSKIDGFTESLDKYINYMFGQANK